MAIPYPYVTDNQYHINTGSYLDQKETSMLVAGYVDDLWYGFGETDVIEMSVFDLDQNPLGWKTINSEKEYKKITMTYLDTLDRQTEYSYLQLVSDFILYKNIKVLVNPIDHLETNFGIVSGSYILTYNFMREMAGSSNAPLIVKDISPSRKEIKLIPAGGNTPRYQAFCLKKIQIKDIAPLLIQKTNQCPYDQIYSRIKDKYATQIAYLKQLLFLTSDGAFIAFLKTLYEDVVFYTNPASLNQPIDRIKRTQGIKTYYQNFLLSNYETISDFISLDDAYDSYTKIRIDQQFKHYGINQGAELISAKQFLVDFFTIEFYHPITLSLKASFESKYYSYFKNALNLGNNTTFTIVDHSYMDERLADTDPLTLLVKLKTELPEEVKIQTSCWVSNISIAPFVINAIVRKTIGGQTIKISPPNFTIQSENVSLYNVNEQYTAADLQNSVFDQQQIDINKKINELRVDYSNFSNFIVFSSAAHRLSNFKTKISNWYMLSASRVTLEENASASLAQGKLYSQYSLERGSIDGQMSDIVNSFDGYESYLFNTGSYVFDPVSKTFLNSSYVVEQDFTASLYDKTNQDSLVNNTPEHIVLDENNAEYLVFLNMIGHYFDNIYLYIANLPSEKNVSLDPTETFSKKMIDYMLDSFGWKVETSYEDMTSIDTYTTASSLVSAEDQTKSIRTRILNTLPQIYKTKGTEEAIKLLLSCYGIPTNLLDIREYGNDDYTTSSLVTYTKRERSCMFHFSGSGGNENDIGYSFSGSGGTFAYITQDFYPKPDIRTVEMKMILEQPNLYVPYQPYSFASVNHSYSVKWDQNWFIHTFYPWAVPSYDARQYYSYVIFPGWKMGFVREYGHMGRIWMEVATISASVYTTGYIGNFSGSFSGSAAKVTGSITNVGVLSSSYFSGSVNGGSIVEISGSVSGSLNGIITGSLKSYGWIYFNGEITGSVGDFSRGTFIQTGVTQGTTQASSKIAYGTPHVYLTSSLLPLFDGNIFNVRIRRNEPEPGYQYISNPELVPSLYDITVQRNENGRRVFRSYSSTMGVYEDNMVWDGRSTFDSWEETGSFGTLTTCSLIFGVGQTGPEYSSVNVSFGNAMVWDVPIGDSDFEIHCNDFSSFAYSGSDAEIHLITRMDYDEPVNIWTGSGYLIEYDQYPWANTYNGSATAHIENKSEYYSTFALRYGIKNVSGVVASGSWIGAKDGNLYTIERLTGSLEGTVSGSLSGSGHGYFLTSSIFNYTWPNTGIVSSKVRGIFSGSLSGSFNGLTSGSITSSWWTQKGYFGDGHWVGESFSADTVTRSLFIGYFSGSASGSFSPDSIMTGYSLSQPGQIGSWTEDGGAFTGSRLGGWTGSFKGILSGSMQPIYASGSFWGSISGSVHNIPSIGNFQGITDQIFFGTLTGSFIGSFTGSSGLVDWTGNTPYYHMYPPLSYFYSASMGGQALFSGSFQGTVEFCGDTDLQWLTHPYATGSFFGSFLQPWTGSPVVLYNKPIIPMDITYVNNNWYPLHATQSISRYCNFLTQTLYTSVFPYEFNVLDLEKTYTTPNYGPNRFKNEKIKLMKQTIAARLDDQERSTANLVTGVKSDSNLLGLYLDPQDAKNRDIVKFYGNNDVISLIADPSNMYSSSYIELKGLNDHYNSFGNRRVLYNELITLYKIYFNRSIFEAAKNIIPARSSVRTGIVVEPTVLERPKYQHRLVASEMNTSSVAYFDVTASHYFHDPITKLIRFSGSQGNVSDGKLTLLYGEFNTAGVSSQSLDYTTIPSNPTIALDFSYLNEVNFNYPVNYNNGYYCDFPDDLQFGNYGSLGGEFGYSQAIGVAAQEDLNDYPHTSGSNRIFLVKKWNKYTIYFKNDSYVRNSNKNEDSQTSHSVWLYNLVGMSPAGYQQMFFTASGLIPSSSIGSLACQSDVVMIEGYPYYRHWANTAKNTPNQRINTIRGTENHSNPAYVTIQYPYVSIAKETFFEVFGGYPRNHYTHKRMQFSPIKFKSFSGKFKDQTTGTYVRSSQTIDTTIDNMSGLEDASLPIQSIETSNINLQQSDNVINQ